jgi:hypothetical protein
MSAISSVYEQFCSGIPAGAPAAGEGFDAVGAKRLAMNGTSLSDMS